MEKTTINSHKNLFNSIKKFILLIPLISLLSGCLLYSIYYIFTSSIGFNRIIGENSFTLDFYYQLIKSKEFQDSFLYTFKLAFYSSCLSLFFSIFLIFILFKNFKDKLINNSVLFRIIQLPLLVPYIIASYMILSFLSQRGVLAQFGIFFNFIETFDQFPIFTNDKKGVGIIVTYIWKTSAFIVTMSFPLVIKSYNKWKDLKIIMNLSDFYFFKEITFSIIFPSILTSFIIVFTFIFTSFETPYILGVTYPEVLAVYSHRIAMRGGIEMRGVLMALNLLMSLISIVLSLLVYIFFKKNIHRNEMGWE